MLGDRIFERINISPPQRERETAQEPSPRIALQAFPESPATVATCTTSLIN